MKFEPSMRQQHLKCDVIINGKKRGTVFPYESDLSNHKFQCQLNFAGLFNPGGFGETMEAAVNDTLIEGRKQLNEMTSSFNDLLAEMEKGSSNE